MDSENQQRYQTAPFKADPTVSSACVVSQTEKSQSAYRMNIENSNVCKAVIGYPNTSEILNQLNSGQLLMVNSRRKNGLIIYKRYHAEFAGPGAAVGGFFDVECQRVIAVGDLSLVHPESYEDRQKAYLIRRQWIRLTQQFTDNAVPLQRAQMILNQFENYFDPATVAQLPDESFALLVGVLPQTIRMVRRPPPSMDMQMRN